LDILNNDFITHDKIVGSVDVSKEILDKYPVQYGDILFQRSSETREEVGSASVYLDKNHTATFGGFVIRGKKIGEYEPNFLNKLLKTDAARDNITSKSGGSTRYNVGQDTLSSVVLSFPSLSEQQKIASFLTKVDEKLTQLKWKKELLEQYKKGAMQNFFSQKIRFKDGNGQMFPEWKEVTFSELYSFISTNSLSREFLNYKEGTVKNIHYGDIHTKFRAQFDVDREVVPFINSDISLVKLKENQYCKEGDLIIADASEDYADIGKAIEILNLGGQQVVSGLHTIHARPTGSGVALGFGGHLMKAEIIRTQIMKIAQGTKVLGLSASRLSDVIIQLPSVLEQAKIARFLSAIDKNLALTQTQIDKAEQWKNGLLQQMFV
jgi:type I restriction enzyme S subunit